MHLCWINFQIHRSVLWPQSSLGPALLPRLDADIVEAQERHWAAADAHDGWDRVFHHIPRPTLYPRVGRASPPRWTQGHTWRCTALRDGRRPSPILPCPQQQTRDEEAPPSQAKQLRKWCTRSLTFFYTVLYCSVVNHGDMVMLKMIQCQVLFICSSKVRHSPVKKSRIFDLGYFFSCDWFKLLFIFLHLSINNILELLQSWTSVVRKPR